MAHSTVLSLVQEFANKKGLPTPNALVGQSSKDAKQFLALLAAMVRDLGRYNWPGQKVRKTWTTLAAENQGSLTDVWGTDFRNLVADTLWHEDDQWAIRGPVTDSEWQLAKVSTVVGDIILCWIGGGEFHLYPAPDAGETISAVVVTEYLVKAAGGTAKPGITVDTDYLIFPDEVTMQGLEYFWNKEKGESWDWEHTQYLGLIGDNKARDSQSPLQLDCARQGVRPAIVLPAGYTVR